MSVVGRSLCRYDQNTWFFVAAVLVPPSRSRNLGRTFMYMFFVAAVYYTAYKTIYSNSCIKIIFIITIFSLER